MTLNEIQKVVRKLQKLDEAYAEIDVQWAGSPYIRDLLIAAIIEEKNWIATAINGQVIETEV